MSTEHRGKLDASGRRVAVVAARFNEAVTRRLADGAVEFLRAHGVADDSIDVYWVAGSFELPQTAAKIARQRRADGVVCVGALVRGETAHFEVLAATVTKELESLGVAGPIPVGFGVITADTMEQAMARAGGAHGNLGWNAALSVVELIDLWRGIDEQAT